MARLMRRVFLKRLVAQQLAGKFTRDHFLRAPTVMSASPDVTSHRLIYASKALHLTCLTCFSLERKGRKLVCVGKSRSESNL